MKNEPAFPNQIKKEIELPNGDATTSTEYSTGISKLEYFAAKAMQGILTGMYTRGEVAEPEKMMEQFNNVIPTSYWFAERMLEESEKRK